MRIVIKVSFKISMQTSMQYNSNLFYVLLVGPYSSMFYSPTSFLESLMTWNNNSSFFFVSDNKSTSNLKEMRLLLFASPQLHNTGLRKFFWLVKLYHFETSPQKSCFSMIPSILQAHCFYSMRYGERWIRDQAKIIVIECGYEMPMTVSKDSNFVDDKKKPQRAQNLKKNTKIRRYYSSDVKRQSDGNRKQKHPPNDETCCESKLIPTN